MLASVADFLDRWDNPLVSDLLSDAPGRLDALLASASGEVRSALLASRRYSEADLASLVPDDLEYLKSIVCDLAMLRLAESRLTALGDERWIALRERADRHLEDLTTGRRVLASTAAPSAGRARAETPLLGDALRVNLLVDRASRYYPSRAQEWPQ